jgi:alkanesulfonate monooxygenase SsuD/methylene tetrahydromethanopterin reductase-like flavin-dependent oxidoreductase (luciferase family)
MLGQRPRPPLCGDHVSFWVGAGSDGLSMVNRFLSLSDHLAVNTAVYLLPLRHPVVVARQSPCSLRSRRGASPSA